MPGREAQLVAGDVRAGDRADDLRLDAEVPERLEQAGAATAPGRRCPGAPARRSSASAGWRRRQPPDEVRVVGDRRRGSGPAASARCRASARASARGSSPRRPRSRRSAPSAVELGAVSEPRRQLGRVRSIAGASTWVARTISSSGSGSGGSSSGLRRRRVALGRLGAARRSARARARARRRRSHAARVASSSRRPRCAARRERAAGEQDDAGERRKTARMSAPTLLHELVRDAYSAWPTTPPWRSGSRRPDAPRRGARAAAEPERAGRSASTTAANRQIAPARSGAVAGSAGAAGARRRRRRARPGRPPAPRRCVQPSASASPSPTRPPSQCAVEHEAEEDADARPAPRPSTSRWRCSSADSAAVRAGRAAPPPATRARGGPPARFCARGRASRRACACGRAIARAHSTRRRACLPGRTSTRDRPRAKLGALPSLYCGCPNIDG